MARVNRRAAAQVPSRCRGGAEPPLRDHSALMSASFTTRAQRFTSLGLEIIASTPAEFREAIASEVKRWARVVKEADIKAE